VGPSGAERCGDREGIRELTSLKVLFWAPGSSRETPQRDRDSMPLVKMSQAQTPHWLLL
jgi:hypothetical protein